MSTNRIAGGLLLACLLPILALPASAQSIKLFDATLIGPSPAGASTTNPVSFNTKTLTLTCPAAPSAIVSSNPQATPDALGLMFEDNFIRMTVGESASNICRNGDPNLFSPPATNCFGAGTSNASNTVYESAASGYVGQNPDTATGNNGTFLQTYGVPGVDVSSLFGSGTVQVKFEEMDLGGFLGSSTIYLVTNCTQQTQTSGPAGSVTGTTITPATGLQQSGTFNGTTNNVVQFDLDLSVASSAGTLHFPAQDPIPDFTDLGITQADYASLVKGTSFAAVAPAISPTPPAFPGSTCFPHNGEVNSAGVSPACKLYTLECTSGTGSGATTSGANCPVSDLRNEVYQDSFDGPQPSLPDVNGFHTGIGWLMASDNWTPASGGRCQWANVVSNITPASAGGDFCPENILISFTGPGLFADGGNTKSTNSTFIAVYGVPMPLTDFTVLPSSSGWVNATCKDSQGNCAATVTFTSTPPAVPNNPDFVTAPIASLSYGVTPPAGTVPIPDPHSFPPAGDVLVPNGTCPNPASAPSTWNTNPFITSATVPLNSGDGQYVVHYYAQDCAGTEELKFVSTNGTWSTLFWQKVIQVDTAAPTIAITVPAANATYTLGQSVIANYSCTDPAPGSGVAPNGCSGTVPSGNAIDTSSTGQKTFTVTATDVAGNTSTKSVTYNVAKPANLALRKHAPGSVQTGSNISYFVGVINRGPGAATSVVVSDPLPRNTSFVSAVWRQVSCSLSGDDVNCSTTTGTSCNLVSNVVTCNIPSLPAFTLSNPTGIAVRVVLKVNAPAGSSVQNTATVSAATPDPVPANNSSTVTTLVTH